MALLRRELIDVFGRHGILTVAIFTLALLTVAAITVAILTAAKLSSRVRQAATAALFRSRRAAAVAPRAARHGARQD